MSKTAIADDGKEPEVRIGHLTITAVRPDMVRIYNELDGSASTVQEWEFVDMMRVYDRVTYVDRVVHVVLEQSGGTGLVEIMGAYMAVDDARDRVEGIKAAGGYAWHRQVQID